MRNLILFFVLVFVGFNVSAQCVPHATTGHAGLCPPASAFPCIIQGQQFDQSIQFEYYDSVDGIVILSMSIDSITNLPEGISYQVFPDSFFSIGETGCIRFTGVSNEVTGNYQLGIYITITIAGIGTFSGEITEIDEELTPIHCWVPPCHVPVFAVPYYLRIVTQGAQCSSTGVCPRDSLVSVEMPELFSSNVFPNPASGICLLSLNRNVFDFDLQIFDNTGKLLQTRSHLSGNSVQVDVRNLRNGIYFYQLISNTASVSKGKIAVIR